MITYPFDFICRHQYNIHGLSHDYKHLVLDYKSKIFNRKILHNKYQIGFNFKYPGLIFEDDEIVTNYIEKVYKPLKNKSRILPRGYIGKETVVVTGIAPSDSEFMFGESSWLFGPSSYILHDMLAIDKNFYFTNVCKNPFPKNKYDKKIANDQVPLTENEFLFFINNKFVFLGKYPIYKRIIDKLNINNYIIINHPAYYIRFGKTGYTEDCLRIKEFLFTPVKVGV